MAKFCQRCGRKLPFFVSFFTKRVLCRDCEILYREELVRIQAELAAELDKVGKEILANKNVTEQQLELLKKQDKNSLLKLYSNIYDQFVSDKELEEEEISVLTKIQKSFNLTNEDVKFDERVRPYIYVNTIRRKGTLPIVDLKMEPGSPVILKKGEVVHFLDIAVLKELKSVSLGYSGGSHGVSIRIAKGITYRVGAHRGHIVKEDRYVETSRGVLLITNQRLLLNPVAGYKPLSIPLNKILSYQCFSNGIEVYKEGREKGYFFAMNKSGSVELFGLCLGFLLGQ